MKGIDGLAPMQVFSKFDMCPHIQTSIYIYVMFVLTDLITYGDPYVLYTSTMQAATARAAAEAKLKAEEQARKEVERQQKIRENAEKKAIAEINRAREDKERAEQAALAQKTLKKKKAEEESKKKAAGKFFLLCSYA
jgi:hypothetical protein